MLLAIVLFKLLLYSRENEALEVLKRQFPVQKSASVVMDAPDDLRAQVYYRG